MTEHNSDFDNTPRPGLEFGTAPDGTYLGGAFVVGSSLMRAYQHQMELAEEAAEKSLHEATHDPLTGAPNRRLIEANVEDRITQGQPLALMYMDLDKFKRINDTLTHGHGDYVLITFVEHMQQIFKREDDFARLGGDEFMSVVTLGRNDKREKDIHAAAEKEREYQQTHAQKFFDELAPEYRELGVGVSIGLEVYIPNSENDKHNAKSVRVALVAEADRKMYERKRASQAAEEAGRDRER